jgi:hypothetical protein
MVMGCDSCGTKSAAGQQCNPAASLLLFSAKDFS